jgi:signal transduction histidine kinase
MKNLKSISSIRLLMVVSQILLALFLGYWLYSQFAEQKKLLKEELGRSFQQAEQQVVDSMLASTIVRPFLTDTSNIAIYMMSGFSEDSNLSPIRRRFKNDSCADVFVPDFSTDSMFWAEGAFSQISGDIQISIIDSLPQTDSSEMSIVTQRDSTGQLLFKSLRIFINSMEQLVADSGGISSFVNYRKDTLLMNILYTSFLKENYAGFGLEWEWQDDSVPSVIDQERILFSSQFYRGRFDAEVSRYQLYLFKALGPQVFFAVLLLLITLISFRLAYQSLKTQRKLIEVKNQFISNISHELKTPVSTLKVALEALLDFGMQKDPKVMKEYLEMGLSEMNRLDMLVNKVLNNSALEDGNGFVQLEELDLKPLLEEVLASLQFRLKKADAKVFYEASDQTFLLFLDKTHLHGVLVNLIDNSIKYNQGKAKIKIQLKQDAQQVELTISDNGPGIPDEYLDKVFEKFFRVPTGDRHNVKGFGLGLNYAWLMMGYHKGSIKVKNLPEGGCIFTLVFPKIAK